MHKFLSAVGFSDIRKQDLKIILDNITEEPDHMNVCKDSEGNELIEYIKFFTPDLGIIVRGTFDEEDDFQIEYYVPYIRAFKRTTNEIVEIEKHADKESYAGVCDDPNLGLTLIFYVNDVADYLNYRAKDSVRTRGACLAALASEGKILLPVEKKKAKIKQSGEKSREELIAEAREGNEEAMQSLSLQEMDMYSIISKRIMKEDIMSIVTTYFMPYGIESDHYGILAEILNVIETVNDVSGEHIYLMEVECNNLKFRLAINKQNLEGIPAIGRRFKGNIWMQGTVADSLK